MSTCNILGHGIIHDTYEDQGWFDLCGWQTPDITYEAFVTGITETYNNNTSIKDRLFSDYVTRLYKECLLDTFVSGGTLNAATGVVTFTNTTGGTLDVSGFNGFTSYWSANTDGSISNSGNTADVKFYGDVYTDQIRRYTNNSTTTKINLSSSNVIKLFAGHSTNEVMKIESGSVTASGNLTVTGTTSYTGAISGTGSVTAIGGFVGNLTGIADTASVATTVTLTDESTDTTCFPVFSQTATGNRALETGSNLTFNSSTGLLASTKLSVGGTSIDNNVIKAAGTLTLTTEGEEIGSNYIQISSETKVGSDGTGHDFWWFGDTSHWYMQWDQSTDRLNCLSNIHQELGDITFNPPNYALTATTTLTIDNSNTSNGIKIGTNVSGVPISIGHSTSETTVNDNLNVTGDLAVDGTSNLDAVDIDGNVQIDGTITVGVNDTGYDVKFFGASDGRYLLWDQTNDRLKFRDNVKAVFGHSNDLQIYHDGSNSYIDDTGTGTLKYRSGTHTFTNADSSKTMAAFDGATSVDLYYDNSKKFETTNTGIDVTGEVKGDTLDIDGNSQLDGTLTVGVDDTGYDVKFFGDTASAYMLWDTSDDDLVLGGAATLKGSRRFEKSTTVNKNLAQGDIIYVGGGSTTEGDIVYMTTAGQWASAVASATTSSTPMLGIALGTDPDVDGVLLRGTYTLNHDVADNQGVPLYLSDTVVGQATVTAPASSGDVVRIIGYNIGDDDEIWFDPDKTWVELA